MITGKKIGILVGMLSTICYAQYNGRGSKATAMANAFVAIADNPWAVAYNPAGLARQTSSAASVFVVPQQFGLPELRTIALAATHTFAFATLGVGFDQFGFDLYKETVLSVAAAHGIDWGVSGGITLNIRRIGMERYGTAHAATVDLGLLAEAEEDLFFGFAVKNISATTIGSQNERLPQVFLLGTRYDPALDFRLSLEVEKDTRHPVIVKCGLERRFYDAFAVRMGVSDNPDKFSAGFAARYSPFEFSYAGYSHPQLGWTHQIELSFGIAE